MRPVTDSQLFLRAPLGCQLIGRSFAYWYPERGFTGFALWGCPDPDDIAQLNTAMEVVLHPVQDRHRSLIDLQLLRTIDPSAFQRMAEYVASRWQGFGETIERQAIIRPSGFVGAVVAGFYSIVPPAFPVRVFDDLVEGLGWLGVPLGGSLHGAITGTRSHAQRADPLVQHLRALLTERKGTLALGEAARKLGVSERTLQRRLSDAKTTFQAEVQAARLAEAQQLMLAGSLSLTRIALELGFASLQHFSSLFRKVNGESPSAWLRRRSEHGQVSGAPEAAR